MMMDMTTTKIAEETFGQRMQRTRTALHLSQSQLAALVGVSAQYINDMEHGRRKMPRPHIAQKIAETLLWPLPYIWTYEDALRIVQEQWELLADAYATIARLDDDVAAPGQVERTLTALDKAIPEVVWEQRV
jgi:transcriptional regulator with XRE-family HTH domain